MLATCINASAPKATEIVVTLKIKAVVFSVFMALTLCSLRLSSATGCFSGQLTPPISSPQIFSFWSGEITQILSQIQFTVTMSGSVIQIMSYFLFPSIL